MRISDTFPGDGQADAADGITLRTPNLGASTPEGKALLEFSPVHSQRVYSLMRRSCLTAAKFLLKSALVKFSGFPGLSCPFVQREIPQKEGHALPTWFIPGLINTCSQGGLHGSIWSPFCKHRIWDHIFEISFRRWKS